MGAASGIRRAGSAALDLADVAAGRLDAFWELTLAPWDVAGGVVLVREAGGSVTTLEGSDDVLQHGSIEPSSVVTRSEEHTSELQSQSNLVCRLLLEKKKKTLTTSVSV